MGILAAHPLLFLLLGLAFSMTANQLHAFGNNFGLQSMVSLLVAIIGLMMAALSPLLLMKFAPVIPMAFGGTSGPSVDVGKHIGAQNMSDANERYGYRPDYKKPGQNAGPSTKATSGEDAEPATASPSMADFVAGPGPGTTSAGTARASAAGASGSTTAAAGTGARAAASGGAAAAEGGLATAGAAESTTGAGAVIGIPTMILAAGATVAHKAAFVAKKGVDLAQTAGEQATDSASGTGRGDGDS
ncbi:hypothetical protein JF66_15685 [Cryobacterium sp. MLB-32]|nr:hypothetical protein JF66_15685 [Cryobacterium sp. MLB-32]